MGKFKFTVLSIVTVFICSQAWAGSKLINVQGKITDVTGKLLSGNVAVTFRIYLNPVGAPAAQNPCTAVDPNCKWMDTIGFVAQNGLFNVTLGAGNSLDSISFNIPYYLGMQVSGDAAELTPRQLLGASAYALGSLGDFNVKGNEIVNGIITVTGITVNTISLNGQDVQSYLVPKGAIMMFAGNCPAGWTSFAPLNTGGPNGLGLFPVGSTTYGGTGGAATHTHTISADGDHNHTLTSAGTNKYNCNGIQIGGIDGGYLFVPTGTPGNCTMQITKGVTTASGPHSHGGATGVTSSVPPYRAIVYCQKQ